MGLGVDATKGFWVAGVAGFIEFVEFVVLFEFIESFASGSF
jgi:hypothetical protein